MIFNYREQMAEIIVKKVGKRYYIDGVEERGDELTLRQLYQLLNKIAGTNEEEVAFMALDFYENPTFTKAHFGVNGFYLFSK